MLIPENTTRKLDSLGRVTLPKGLRNRFGIKDNDELELYTAEIDGISVICFAKIGQVNKKYLECVKTLEELGLEVPDALRDLVEGR